MVGLLDSDLTLPKAVSDGEIASCELGVPMARGAVGLVFLWGLFSACGDGAVAPEEQSSPEVIIEGKVTSFQDGSQLQGVAVLATRRESYNCDIDFCSYRTVTIGSAETDAAGYYRMSLPSGCVDIRVSKAGYIQSGTVPLRYCTPGTSVDPPSEDLRIDIQMYPQEPTVIVEGRVTSSIDGNPVWSVRVGLYTENQGGTQLTGEVVDYGGYYSLSANCEEVLFVQARCLESPFPYANCTGWEDSERVAIRSECPGPGSPAVSHRVDFVLDPAQ